MTELTLSTPSILFSAISLILLAYTNRFLSYAQGGRTLKADHDKNPSAITRLQLANLRRRLYMARQMQLFGVSSLLLCVVCTFLIYIGLQMAAVYTFGVALVLLVISLGISIRELLISVKALEIHLDTLERMKTLTATTGRNGTPPHRFRIGKFPQHLGLRQQPRQPREQHRQRDSQRAIFREKCSGIRFGSYTQRQKYEKTGSGKI